MPSCARTPRAHPPHPAHKFARLSASQASSVVASGFNSSKKAGNRKKNVSYTSHLPQTAAPPSSGCITGDGRVGGRQSLSSIPRPDVPSPRSAIDKTLPPSQETTDLSLKIFSVEKGKGRKGNPNHKLPTKGNQSALPARS